MVVKGSLQPSRYQHCVAAPDVVGEIKSIARELQHSPAGIDREMQTVGRIKAGQRLEKLAAQIVEAEPAQAIEGLDARMRRAARSPNGQLEMGLC